MKNISIYTNTGPNRNSRIDILYTAAAPLRTRHMYLHVFTYTGTRLNIVLRDFTIVLGAHTCWSVIIIVCTCGHEDYVRTHKTMTFHHVSSWGLSLDSAVRRRSVAE